MAKPKRMSGVGKGAQVATRMATTHGVVSVGQVISYTAPVLENDEGAEVPALCGLEPLAERITYVGTASGELHMVPDGHEDKTRWLDGTKTMVCVKSRSGHWMIPISKWDLLKKKGHGCGGGLPDISRGAYLPMAFYTGTGRSSWSAPSFQRYET